MSDTPYLLIDNYDSFTYNLIHYLDEWAEDFMVILKAAAKGYGCSELRGMAVRKGWMTKLKPLGWEEMFTTVRCTLGD